MSPGIAAGRDRSLTGPRLLAAFVSTVTTGQ